MVYADSQSPISTPGFRFTGTPLVEAFRSGQARLATLACDILITPHPDASQFWQRLRKRDNGDPSALLDREACRTFATNARDALERRLASERTP
jgi:metallo-beta-lactamase class B